MQKKSSKKSKKKSLICSVHGAPGIFSVEELLKDLMKVSLYLFVFRLGYVFVFAYFMGESWEIRNILRNVEWGVFDFAAYLPVIAFKSNPAVFATLNSYAILAMAATEFLIFVAYIFRKRRDVQYKFWAWYLGILMTIIQYAVLLWLSRKVRFGVDADLWIPLTGLAIISTLLVFLFKNRVYHNAEIAKD